MIFLRPFVGRNGKNSPEPSNAPVRGLGAQSLGQALGAGGIDGGTLGRVALGGLGEGQLGAQGGVGRGQGSGGLGEGHVNSAPFRWAQSNYIV